jgi:hypothetical protein
MGCGLYGEQVDGPTLIHMHREDAIDELQLSEEQASAMVDELGLLLGLDALDLHGQGTLTKRELIRGIGESPDVAALFGLARCESKRLHELFPDQHEVTRRWLPFVRAARAAQQRQHEVDRQKLAAEAAAIEAGRRVAEVAAAQLQNEFLQEHAALEQLRQQLEELRRQEVAHFAESEVCPV